MIYDCRFHLKASTSPVKEWSAIDVTIWNLAFPERALRNCHRDGLQSSTPSFTNYRPLHSRQPHPKDNQSAWIGTRTQMNLLALSFITKIIVIDVCTTLPSQRSIIKPTNALTNTTRPPTSTHWLVQPSM